MAIKALGEMSISEAHEILDAFWNEAGKHDWIIDRTAWALYMTWKQADARTFSDRYLKRKKEEGMDGYQPTNKGEQRGYQPKPNGTFGYQPANKSSVPPSPPTSGSNIVTPNKSKKIIIQCGDYHGD